MTFVLSDHQLLDIARKMRRDLSTGLERDNTDLLCIPTYVNTDRLPASGRVLAVDVGGTNVRSAVVFLENHREMTIEKGPIKEALPLSRGTVMGKTEFLDFLVDLIRRLDPPRGLPVGYCFSYPTLPTMNGDAVILNWTKELFVKDTIGEKAGEMLLNRLSGSEPGLIGDKVFVINDTIATLLAGKVSVEADTHIGLIVGTGTNIALLLPPKIISKINHTISFDSPLPLNLESANFLPPHLNSRDEALDASSRAPSRHRFEKAVSGAYLPYLFKLSCPDSRLDPAQGSAALFEKAYSNDPGKNHNTSADEALVARQIVERSAALIAAVLAGVTWFLVEKRQVASVCVTAEGGLFYAHPHYKKAVKRTLDRLLSHMELHDTAVGINRVPNTNLLGSAIAGLFPVDI